MKLQINIENLLKKEESYEVYFNKDDIDIPKVTDRVLALINIKRNGNLYNASGYLKYSLNLVCSRCMNTFSLDKKDTFDYEFKKVVRYENIYKDSDNSEENNQEFVIKNNIIDFEPLFHDLIILSMPMKPLCSENCRGLCPVCGVNLNKTKCEHTKETVRIKEQ